MLMAFKTQKAMPADANTVWAEITQANFAKQFLPEISTTKDRVCPSYIVEGKVVSWNQNPATRIEMANSDLNVTIDSIEISLEKRGNKAVVSLEVEFNVPMDRTILHSLKAIRALFEQKLIAMKQNFEQAQINLAFA